MLCDASIQTAYNIRDIAFDISGNLYIAQADKERSAIRRILNYNNHIEVFASPCENVYCVTTFPSGYHRMTKDILRNVYSITVDNNGTVYMYHYYDTSYTYPTEEAPVSLYSYISSGEITLERSYNYEMEVGDVYDGYSFNIRQDGYSLINIGGENENIQFGKDIEPFVDVQQSLGAPNKRWKSIYVGPGSLHLKSVDIDQE